MKPPSLMHKMRRRVQAYGWRSAARHFRERLLMSVSPHYRFDPAKESKRNTVPFVLFIVKDAGIALLDRGWRLIEQVLTHAQDIDDALLTPISLYRVNTTLVPQHPIIYSFGVGRNIDFDKEIAARFNTTVYLFDPTPPAEEFIKSVGPLDPRLSFEPWGIWTHTRPMKFYYDRNVRKQNNLSITNYFNTDTYIIRDCFTLSDIMKRKGHSRVDVLKMDIEGAALPIFEEMLNIGIFPSQIIGELEMPQHLYGASTGSIVSFIRRKRKLFTHLRACGYQISTYGKAEFIATRSLKSRN